MANCEKNENLFSTRLFRFPIFLYEHISLQSKNKNCIESEHLKMSTKERWVEH